MASITSYASSNRYGLMVSKFCSRSHGQPPGARSRAMISTSLAKPSAGVGLGFIEELSAYQVALCWLADGTSARYRNSGPRIASRKRHHDARILSDDAQRAGQRL